MPRLVAGISKGAISSAIVRDIGPTSYIEYAISPAGKLSKGQTVLDWTGVKDIDNSALQYAWQNDLNIIGNVDLSSLEAISGISACDSTYKGCKNLTGINLSNLNIISGTSACQNMFEGCNNLTDINVNNFTIVSGQYGCSNMFKNCTKLTSANLSNLTTISGQYGCQYMFSGCSKLNSINLDNLTNISGNNGCYGMFYGSGLTAINLPSLTTASGLSGMFYGCSNLTSINLQGITNVSTANACAQLFYNCMNLQSIDLSNLTIVTGANAFARAFERTYNLSSINLCNLKKVTNYSPFNYCFINSGIRSADLSSLEVVSGMYGIHGMFESCSKLEEVNLSSLVTLSNTSGFAGGLNRTKLTTVSFDSLKNITGARALYWGFCYCTLLSSIYFPALTTNSFGSNYDQFSMLVGNMSQTVTIHFPNNLDPEKGCTTISSLSDYPKFSNPNTVLAFDLPSTAHLIGDNSVEYERNPKYDTVNALAWRVLDGGTINDPIIDWTPYYTSSTDDPTVGTTIYSDSTCTQAVTTVNSIA